MGQSKGYWIFEENEGVTSVTWGFKGEMPWMLSFMTLTMNDQVGKSFESGLSKIKALSEEMATSTPDILVEMIAVEAMTYYSITTEMTTDEAMTSETYSTHFGLLGAFLGENNAASLGKPFVYYHVWDMENGVATLEFCFPNSAEQEETDRIKKGISFAGNTLRAIKTGDFDTKEQHDAIYAFAEASGLNIGVPWEVYADPEVDGIYVEVYYPILEE